MIDMLTCMVCEGGEEIAWTPPNSERGVCVDCFAEDTVWHIYKENGRYRISPTDIIEEYDDITVLQSGKIDAMYLEAVRLNESDAQP